MKIQSIQARNLGTGFLYFYVHFVTELICFFVLSSYTENAPLIWLLTFAYDMLAFAPQSLIGFFSDKHTKVPLGLIGLGLLAAAAVLQRLDARPFLSLVVLCLGNACTHVNGAEVTLRTSGGRLSPSAVFVSGGSFGVISGKLLSAAGAPFWLPLLLAFSAVPFTILAQMYLKEKNTDEPAACRAFQYNNPKVSRALVISLSVIVVIVRGFMAYGIPISWKKTTLQTVLLFAFMGIGKALGGVLADLFGVKKVALCSVAAALPFLLFGDNHMLISLIGVLFFSMTMSVTLAVIVSALPRTPGLAFGFTTIGLFMGAAPVFFFRITGLAANCIMLSVMTAVCLVCLFVSIRKDECYESLV